MKTKRSFSVRARGRSFRYAWEGIRAFFKSEHNALIHLLATVVVIVLSFAMHISTMEAIVLIMVIGFVWIAELFNTAIEKTLDLISAERCPEIKLIKDLAAAAVLIAALIAIAVGCFVFIPKFW